MATLKFTREFYEPAYAPTVETELTSRDFVGVGYEYEQIGAIVSLEVGESYDVYGLFGYRDQKITRTQ